MSPPEDDKPIQQPEIQPAPRRLTGRPFPPGVSGNPSGRPVRKPLTDWLRRLGKIKPPRDVAAAMSRFFPEVPYADWDWNGVAMARALQAAAKGKSDAIKEVLDRIEGKPLQAVHLRAGGSDRDLSDDELNAAIADGLARLNAMEVTQEETAPAAATADNPAEKK
jgi:hypothetical protein